MTITSHALEIFRQGVWASLTGGWCYDPRQTLACNVVHMYLWLFLFVLPLVIVLCFNLTWPLIGAYALVIGILFSTLKTLNYYLHTIFDTHEPIDVMVNADRGRVDGEEEKLEEGVIHMEEEDPSDMSSHRIQSEVGPITRASTLYEALGENSLADSSREIDEFVDDNEDDYTAWGGTTEGATGATAQAGLDQIGDGGEANGAGRRKKSNSRKRSAGGGGRTERMKEIAHQLSSPPDYLAVEADVHSMPNEPMAKDDTVDVESIELRTVRSDSKLVPSSKTTTLRKGGSALTTNNTEIEPERKQERRILFVTNPMETSQSQNAIDERGKFDEDDEEDEEDDVTEENADQEAVSSSTMDGLDRKYSEPAFTITGSAVDSIAENPDNGGGDKRRESFDRFSRKQRSMKRGMGGTGDNGGNAVRRTRSTMETCAQWRGNGRGEIGGEGVGTASTSSTLLSEACLEKCRGKGVRKSYPGKTSSTDIFLLQHTGPRKDNLEVDGFGHIMCESNSVGSCGTGLEGSSLMEIDEHSGGSDRMDMDDEDKSGQNTLYVGRVTRFLSVDVPLTEIPERESESERTEGFPEMVLAPGDSAAVSSVVDLSQSGTAAYRGDGEHAMNSSFYATASEESSTSPIRPGSPIPDGSKRPRRRWASSDDQSPQSPRTKLIRNLRDTLETLKSETPTTGSSTTTAVGEADRFVADLQALKDASTPDLRWLFDDAAAVLHVSSYHSPTVVSSAASSPGARPRLNSLRGQDLLIPRRSPDTNQTPSLPTTLSRICSPESNHDVNLIQQQFRERLMEEIKRLLEEIIDSHPEALEAIESVRQAKLARIAGGATGVVETTDSRSKARSRKGKSEQSFDDTDDGTAPGPSGVKGTRSMEDSKTHDEENKKPRKGDGLRAVEMGTDETQCQDEHGGESTELETTATRLPWLDGDSFGDRSSLAQLARKRNVHVARSHDDTSEGAVHSFQDSDGKWYTYSFNADGVATAQLLGSDRALMELIAQQQDETMTKRTKRQISGGRGKSGTSTSADRDSRSVTRSASHVRQQEQLHTPRIGYGGAATPRMLLARTGSSSSEESFLTLDAPASILHVGGGTATAGRHRSTGTGQSDTSPSARITLPMRLHQRVSMGGPGGAISATTPSASARRRGSGVRSLVPLRQMLNRSGGTITYPTSAGSLALIPRLDSVPGATRDATSSFTTATAAPPHSQDDATTPGEYSTIALSSSNFLALSGSLRTPSDLSHTSFRARFFATLAGGVEGLPSMIGATNTIGGVGAHGKTASSGSSTKRKQYYRVSLCPEMGVCCCPNWLTSRLTTWKFWTPNGAGENEDCSKRSGWFCCPKKTIKLSLDRLRLMAIFDRNRTKLSAFIDVLLAVMVTLVACGIFSRPLFHDLELVLACVVTAGAQFSLMKSVQPDAASPVHGYNALVAYSRPVYYCLFGLMLYAIDRYLTYHPSNPYATETLYSSWPDKGQMWYSTIKDFIGTFFLFLPLVFTFGLLPQLNTFAIYSLEQLDMLVFGGTALVGLSSGVFSVTRSLVCSTLLICLNYFSLHPGSHESTQRVLFSAFCGASVSVSYLLSRSSSDPRLLFTLLASFRSGWSSASSREEKSPSHEELRRSSEGSTDDPSLFNAEMTGRHRREFSISMQDPLPSQICDTMILRMKHDIVAASILGGIYFALHCSSLFTLFSTTLTYVLPAVAVTFGFVCHYILPQMRQHTPWRVLAAPLLKTHEHRIFDVDNMAKLMPFERLYAILNLLERNVLYPLVIIHLVTASEQELVKKYGLPLASILMAVACMKLLRTAFCNAAQLYLPLGAAVLLGLVDFPSLSFTLLLDFYLIATIYPKFIELVLKLQYIFSYVAPWQISWGSAFHAFAQPTAIPHSAFTLAIAGISSFLSAPLNPFLGSAVFLMSYVRPVKFWEKNYNTKRVDHSNTRLISQIDRGPMTDDSNLNAIFYEHLTRSLQRSLAGDLQLGRLATPISSGDCFILASFYLNCLVHVIEVGNGFVTFQLRGLEFRGTYCQQREVEAINEEVGEQGCCCCGGDGANNAYCCVRGFLSFNAVWNLSWLSWRVTAAKFVLEGYSVSDNSALSLLQVIELRKLLVTLYVKCILFYTLKSSKLQEWLSTETIVSALDQISKDQKYVDVDPSFCSANDDDYDCRLSGISRQSFCHHYLPWLEYCWGRRGQITQKMNEENVDGLGCDADNPLTAMCFALSLVGRRVLGTAAQGRHTTGAESFLYGLHALFKGDFRITCSRDEWVFADMDILKSVIAPAVRMALKLHQDHFTVPDDFESMSYLFDMIDHYDRTIFISHENDPAWRNAVLNNTRSLLALRHVFEDGQDDFKIIMLNRRHMNFRVIALNKECVRAFWAGQQQELIFLRNRNPERGSIQNARQVLRNMINSSADQPIGYPIYVSPLTTSFCETHEQVSKCVGPSLTLSVVGGWCSAVWRRLLGSCSTSRSSNLPSAAAAAASGLPPAGLVHFRSSTPGSTLGEGRMVETTFTTRPRHSEQRQHRLQRTRPIPRPRTSLLNPPTNRRTDRRPVDTARASFGAATATGVTQAPPNPPPRHGSAPPVMQRSMTHPLRASSVTSQLLRQDRSDRHQSPARVHLTPSDSQELATLKHVTTSAPAARNSVVSDNPAHSPTGASRVSLGSLLALNVDEETSFGASSCRRGQRVRIVDVSSSAVLDDLDTSTTAGAILWPREEWRRKAGRQWWMNWRPEKGMEGSVVHKWTALPVAGKHGNRTMKTVLLVNVMDGKYYVPICEEGVEWIGDEL